MEAVNNDLIAIHVSRAVCLTYHGCMEHVRFMSLADRWQLCFHMKVEYPEQLARAIWDRVKKRNHEELVLSF